MPISQRDIANQMVNQLRTIDPAASAEIGTPERKIIDTVAQAITDAQVDIGVLGGSLDIDSKFGANLDNFIALFGIARQKATYARGFATFSRTTASATPIRIPVNTRISSITAPEVDTDPSETVYETIADAILLAGETAVDIPIRAVVGGSSGNAPPGAITEFWGTPVLGITSVTNGGSITGGVNEEDDDEFKVRFKNTVFRNMAGTQDQYMALGASTPFTTKVNVIGPISRWEEILQVPSTDDATNSGNGLANEYTTALTTIPYAKHIYTDVPTFLATPDLGFLATFYTDGVDYQMNTTSRNKGDAYRRYAADPTNEPNPVTTPFRPNITLYNVYTGVVDGIEMVRPDDLLLFEMSYMSASSRNDWKRNITNCVDVFINGMSRTLSSTVSAVPKTTSQFVNNVNSKFHFHNYRRKGQPERRPVLGNIFHALYLQPTVDLPDQIVVPAYDAVDETIYLRDIHYHLVEDVSELYGTVRARNGIEWMVGVNGILPEDDDEGPWTGLPIHSHGNNAMVVVDNYAFDKNILDLQTGLEGNKQVTTDVLAHRTRYRFFKSDVTVIYDKRANAPQADEAISTSVRNYFDGLYYGTTIQLADVIESISNVSSIDAVRWTTDTPGSIDDARMYEADMFGNKLCGASITRRQMGDAGRPEIQEMVITGSPTSGTLKINYNGTLSGTIAYNANAAAIDTAFTTASGAAVTVTGLGTHDSPFIITWDSNGSRTIPTVTDNLFRGGPYVIDTDFVLQDDELPQLPLDLVQEDSQIGMIIHRRAQSTWTK